MKEALRKLKGININTDAGDITLQETYREGKIVFIQMIANLINCTIQLRMIRLRSNFMTSKRTNQLKDSVTNSIPHSIVDKLTLDSFTRKLLSHYVLKRLKLKRVDLD